MSAVDERSSARRGRARLGALALAVVASTGAGATAPTDETSARWAAETGALIHQKDMASARATDLLLETIGFGFDERLRGWITLRREDGWVARFVGEGAEGRLVALYDVVVGAEAESVTLLEEPEPLDQRELSMFLARQTAAGAMPYRCTESYNTVVLGQGEEWLVYLLAATPEPGRAVVGGHFRVRVAASGREALAVEPFSTRCLTMTTAPATEGLRPVGLMVRHELSESPLETHTYLSLLHDLPIYVMTDRALWRVSDGSSEVVDCEAEPGRECDHWRRVISGGAG